MGHGKETPRQKMIGMMYLVLTALLALNVSAEVLNAFILIDNSLTKTSQNFQLKNEDVYTGFEKALSENGAKVKPYKDLADEVKLKSQELFDVIHNYKMEIVTVADGPEADLKNIQKKDDNNIPGQLMVLEGRGEKLKEEIDAYRGYLLGIITDTARYSLAYNGINNTLNTNDIIGNTGEKVPWVDANFNHLPLAGVITLMSKMQNDIRNAEAEILGYLFGQIDAGSFKFNKLEAIVNASTNYVLVGNEYKAEVFIAASDSTVEPEIFVGESNLKVIDGKGQYVGNTSSVGFKTWSGVIKMKSPATGEILEFPFKSEYQVAEAGLVVSPTKMNVFYIGVDNPVDISVPGVPADKVSATISGGGSISRSGSGYVVRVKSVGDVYISASADFSGNVKQMGKKVFRVKRVPDPVAKIGSDPLNAQGGVMAKNMLLAQAGIKADLENFAFDLKYNVTGFTVSASIKGYTEEASSNSALFTSQQKGLINKIAPGQKVYIENITAKGPDGSTRKLGSINLKLR